MSFFDLIRMGLMNLWRRRLRSLLTIIAVLIGATAVVAMLILAFGARNFFLGQLAASGMLNRITVVRDKDAQIDPFGGGGGEMSDEGVPLTEAMVTSIGARDHVTAITPVVSANPLQKVRRKEGGDGKKYQSYGVTGIRPDPAFAPSLSSGRNLADNEADKGKIVLARSLATRLKYDNPDDAVGDTLIFTTWEGYRNIDSPLPPQDAPEEEWRQTLEIEAVVIGVTAPGPGEGDSFVTEAWARRLRTQKNYGKPSEEAEATAEEQNREINERNRRLGRQTSEEEFVRPEPTIEIRDEIADRGFDIIFVQVDSADNVEGLATAIENDLGVGAVTAEEFLEQFLRIFTIVSIVLAAIGGIALLVAAVGIVNTMVMAVMERTKEIGVLKAVGASRRTVWAIFTFEAALLGFWGGVIGIGTGYGLTLIANYFVNRELAGEGFAGSENLAELPWWLALGVVAFTTLIGVIAGLYPAARAARLKPVDALRRE